MEQMKGLSKMIFYIPDKHIGIDPGPIGYFLELIDQTLYPVMNKFFPRKFPKRTPPLSVHRVEIHDIELKTADFKILFLDRVLCETECDDAFFDYDKIANIVRMALEIASGEMTSHEINNDKFQSLSQNVFKWYKLPELLGGHITLRSLYIEPHFHY